MAVNLKTAVAASTVPGFVFGAASQSATNTGNIRFGEIRGNTVICAGNQGAGIRARKGIKEASIKDNSIGIAGTVTYGIRTECTINVRVQDNRIDGSAGTAISNVASSSLLKKGNTTNGTVDA